VEKLRSAMQEVMQSPAVVTQLGRGGNRILRMPAAEAQAFVKREIETWAPVIRQAGISAE